MNERKNNEKFYVLITLGIAGAILITLGITYAYWRLTKEQTNENVVNTACLEVDIESEQDDINLPKAYPISDEEGANLVPFKFTIHNKCDDNASYQINLESMEMKDDLEIPEDERLNPKYLKFKLNEEGQAGITGLLTGQKQKDITMVTPTIINAYDAHKLSESYLLPQMSKKYEFRLWLDGDITAEEIETMNKIFVSKISITSTYAKELPSFADALVKCGQSGKNAVECMKENSYLDSENLSYDNTNDNNLRYIKNPNNYIDIGDKYENDIYNYAFSYNVGDFTYATKEGCINDSNYDSSKSSCLTKQNSDNLYYLQSRFYVYAITETFKSLEECQAVMEKSAKDYSVACERPEEVYYIQNTEIYDNQEDCLTNMSYSNDNNLIKKCEPNEIVIAKNTPILYRIIGAMNNIETSSKNKNMLKIVRSDSLPFIENNSFDWVTLIKMLNPNDIEINKISENNSKDGVYWNSQKFDENIDGNNYTIDFTNIGLSDEAKTFLEKIKWKINYIQNGFNLYANDWYNIERNNNAKYEYINYTGLLYMSDLFYALGDDECLAKKIDDWNTGETLNDLCSSSVSYNIISNYFGKRGLVTFDMGEESDSFYSMRTTNEYSYLFSNNSYLNEMFDALSPAFYLKENVKIISGNGSKENPYKIEI